MGYKISLDRLKIIIDNVSVYNVAENVMQDNEDLEPLSVEECWRECPKWQQAI